MQLVVGIAGEKQPTNLKSKQKPKTTTNAPQCFSVKKSTEKTRVSVGNNWTNPPTRFCFSLSVLQSSPSRKMLTHTRLQVSATVNTKKLR